MKDIEWKPIKGFEGYEISNYGDVRSHKYKKIQLLKPRYNRDGYIRYALLKNGKAYERTAHYLVIQAFGPKKD